MTVGTPVRVVKIGGRVQASPELAPAIAARWRAEPGALCLVHGGGDEISALQRRVGREPAFIGGRRVTTDADIELLRMTLSGVINKRLVARLNAAGVSAIGISGEDGALIAARALEASELGRVGVVDHVNARLLHHLLDGGHLPVISPLSHDASNDRGHVGDAALNVNGDDAAAAIAVSLGARELLLVADVPGLHAGGHPEAELDVDQAAAPNANGVAAGGMVAKLQAAIAALEGGVDRVRIGDIGVLTGAEQGTVLLPSRSVV
jgi:acetylglutamate kinase